MRDVLAPYVRSVRGACATTAASGAALAAVLLTGCAGHPTSSPGSVTSCVQFGTNAIRHHATVSALPAACRGLSQAEVNQAVSQALRASAAGVHGKVSQRELVARNRPYLAYLVRPVPAPARPAAAPLSGPPSHVALSAAALVAWLITIALGTAMMARWIRRARPGGVRPGGAQPGGARPGGARPGRRRWPARNVAHLALAVFGLLAWVGYLATGTTALAWTACGLLFPAAGLGMTLVILAPARGARRPAVLVVGVHIGAAFITILLSVLAAIGSG